MDARLLNFWRRIKEFAVKIKGLQTFKRQNNKGSIQSASNNPDTSRDLGIHCV